MSSTNPFMSFTHRSVDLCLCVASVSNAKVGPPPSNQHLDVSTMTSPTSSPVYPSPTHILGAKPPGYVEATVLEAQTTDSDASLPVYSPPRPSVPWPGQSEAALFNVERTIRRARLGERRNRTLACFMLLACLLIAIFIVVVIIEVVGHLDQ